jgi:hypothetical protein
MGADLYISSLPDEDRKGGFEVSEAAVRSGYFRDSYGGWGLFSIMTATLGETISWWHISDRVEWFNKKADWEKDGGQIMTPQGCQEFWAWFQPKLSAFISLEKYYRNVYEGQVSDGATKTAITEQKDIEGIRFHADLFMKFYRYANELGSPVGWSV